MSSVERTQTAARDAAGKQRGAAGATARLTLPEDVAARLRELTPGTYTGLAAALVAHLD